MQRYGTSWLLLPVLAAGLLLPAPSPAQRADPARTILPICFGGWPRVIGLRLNYRDARLERGDGINATIWVPYEPGGGVVNGVALGLPATGAGRINGLVLGIFGAGASDRIRGTGLAPVGIGAGDDLEGIMLGGIGVGSGGRMRGLVIGGLGAGSGGGFTGVAVG